ncbi:hypothetical protein TIFTF001_022157 [Ficus carica]|uniref:glucan endo-1,3-beta-D-glucosidase n=1 Tax=Ficus carica TaxID=3494 RepID=A0AA88AZD0_FICCA|nr:hypothetical protein TIFTF001_022157 [Ficus carica]
MTIVPLLIIRALLFSAIAVIPNQIGTAKASLDIGVCYGMQGDNLPPAADVINLYKRYNIGKIRLFEPQPAVLQALRGSGICVTIGIQNQHLAPMAATRTPSSPVMESVQALLNVKNLTSIKVTTVVPGNILGWSNPPSIGRFSDEAASDIRGVIRFLSTNGAPLMVNVYPYFVYSSDPGHVRLDYSQFTATGPVVHDRNLSYDNMLDAVVDAFLWAMEREGVTNVKIVVAESGWPSAGNGNFSTPELASTYNKNFVKHMLSNGGTPKRPGPNVIEGFIFAMFNENLKPAGVEQNFGLFYSNMNPVYPVFQS